MLSANQSEECIEYGTLTKKVDNGKVSNMLFKDVCICVNMKKKSKTSGERLFLVRARRGWNEWRRGVQGLLRSQ